MDTRKKIIAMEEAQKIAEANPACWITGRFEPLLAAHARRVRQAKASGHLLIAVVTDEPDALLPVQARAELVAALHDVDYVVIGDGAPQDAGMREDFIDHVIRRHQGTGV